MAGLFCRVNERFTELKPFYLDTESTKP